MSSGTRKSMIRTMQGGAAILSAVTLLAACSSSTSGKAVGAPAGSTTSGAGSTSNTAPVTSTSPATSSSSASSSSASTVSGNPGSGFCNDARAEQAQEAKQASAFTTFTPAELEKFEEQAAQELPKFAAEAPSAIKSQVAVLVQVDQKIFAALKAVNWDFSKIDPSTFGDLDTPALTAASDAVTNYLEKVCGVSESDSATP